MGTLAETIIFIAGDTLLLVSGIIGVRNGTIPVWEAALANVAFLLWAAFYFRR